MRSRFTVSMLAVAVAALAAVFWTAAKPLGQARRSGQLPPYRAPRAADGHADLNGIWQALVTANWDLHDHEAQPGPHPELMGAYGAGPAGQSIIEGGEIPYQPWAAAKQKENLERRTKADVSDDEKWHELGDPEFTVDDDTLVVAEAFRLVAGDGTAPGS